MITNTTPAYPQTTFDDKGHITSSIKDEGLTIRQYYAGLAMQTLINKYSAPWDYLAEKSVLMADNLISELNK
jgi:hypothetical protein